MKTRSSEGGLVVQVPCTLMRGGTSKCWIFKAGDLPAEGARRDAVIARLFGSPGFAQIDGIGGGSSTTSKCIVVDGSDRETATVTYRFAQVSIDGVTVEWLSNCGNCASALALYSVQEGLVPLSTPVTTVTLVNAITGLVLEVDVDSLEADQVPVDGGTSIPGTAYPGVGMQLKWGPPSWSTLGPTLPTGEAVDVLDLDGRSVRATLVDAGAPAVLALASDFGIDLSAEGVRGRLEALLPDLMRLRKVAGVHFGLPEAGLQSIPKVGLIGPSADRERCDVEARMVSMTALHPSIGLTSAVAIAAASGVTGSVVQGAIGAGSPTSIGRTLRIGTLAGPVSLDVELSESRFPHIIYQTRSARRIADATAHVASGWEKLEVLSA